MIVIERTVDISKPIQTETLRGNEFKLEANAHTFRISVANNGAAVTLTGSVSASMLLADGSGLTLGGSLDNGVAVLTLPQAAYGVPGRFLLAIYSVQTGATEAETVKTCIYACVGAVINTYGDQQYDPGNLIPDAETLAAYIEACQTATTAANDAAGRAETAALTAVTYAAQTGKTDAEKTQARTNIGAASDEDVSSLKSAMGEISLSFHDGYYINVNNAPMSSGSYSYSDYIPVYYGQKLKIECYFHDSARIVFVNEAKIEASAALLAIANTAAGNYYNEIIDVPNGAAFMRLSTLTAEKSNTSVYTIVESAIALIPGISENTKSIETPVLQFDNWKQGTPSDDTATARVYIPLGYLKVGGEISIVMRQNGLQYIIAGYADDKLTEQVTTTGWIRDNVHTHVAVNSCYYAVIVSRNNYTDVTPNDVEAIFDITYNRRLNTIVSNLENATTKFNNWRQGAVGQPQNLNRISLYLGNIGKGNLRIKDAPNGVFYGVNKYTDGWYQTQISASGWQTADNVFGIKSDEYIVVICAKTNWGAIDDSAVTGMSVSFESDTGNQIEKNSAEIVRLKETCAQNGVDERYSVPDYYFSNNYITGKVATINSEAKKCYGEGDVFAFITDMHWRQNAKKSPALLNYIYHNTHVDKLFGGGDYSNEKNQDDSYFDVGSTIRDAWRGKSYFAIGNHEYLGSGAYGITTENELAYDFGAYYENEVVYGSKLRNYFYIDNNGSKIRYIFLNRYAESTNSGQGASDGLEQEQLTWFEDVALNVETGWSIIVVLHNIFGYNIISDNTIKPFVTTAAAPLVSIIENYSGNGEIVAVISGHAHLDIVLHLSNGIPVILTTCDKNKTGGEPMADPDYWADRADGTINEQAFDVMMVDIANRQIKAIRIGCPAQTWTQDGDNYARSDSVQERVVQFRQQ